MCNSVHTFTFQTIILEKVAEKSCATNELKCDKGECKTTNPWNRKIKKVPKNKWTVTCPDGKSGQGIHRCDYQKHLLLA